jgi:ribonucleoside-diphosphate reductase alpha chain
MSNLEELKKTGEAPEWYSEESYTTVCGGYLLDNETPKQMYKRVAKSAASYLSNYNATNHLEDIFFDLMWRNWLCPATPVLSNLGTDRALPISCYGTDVGDNLDEIFGGVREAGKLSAASGGVGINFDRLRPSGSPIKGGLNGKTGSILGWIKIYDATGAVTSQGQVRRGAYSANLSITHKDWPHFIRMRRPEGDVNFQCLNTHHCSIIPDSFMKKVVDGEKEAREKWRELLKTRMETGESYIMFSDTVNKNNPEGYNLNNLKVGMTNICSEITLFTDSDHSFICCLSSLNAAKYDEWKDSDLVFYTTLFLDAVLSEFIEKASAMSGFEKVIRSAVKGRAIGIGVLGWHTLLQEKMIPFDSFQAMALNNEMFKSIKEKAVNASKELAIAYGEPEWLKGTGMRNSHLLAVAPTRSNSIISGDVSAGIEPIIANAYTDKTAKGVFLRQNRTLKIILKKHNRDIPEVWKSINAAYGSVQHLDFLSPEEKEVFKTAYEINQMAIIRQASQRQKYICQSQSLNLFFSANADPRFIHKVHLEAWKMGIKTLYYCRTSSVLRADSASRGDECKACEA